MKQITIFKKNELVRGSDLYSLNAKRALNAIYWAIQKNDLYKYEHFSFTFVTLRKMMNLEKVNDYVERMKEALQELQQPVSLNNFYHPIQKVKYNWYSLSFLDEVGFRKEENGEWIAVIKVNSSIKYLMQIEGNFTKLDLIQYLNKFRTKYAMKLYEYLKSFSSYRYIDISQKHIIKLLGIKNDDKTYKHYAKLKILIERQLKEIRKKTDLIEVSFPESKIVQKDLSKKKIFRILISKKNKRAVKQQDAKNILDALLKRF